MPMKTVCFTLSVLTLAIGIARPAAAADGTIAGRVRNDATRAYRNKIAHGRRRAGQAQPDGLRSAPAVGASAARNPSACSPERATKPGCARTPCRRPRAAFGVGQDHDAERFAKAKGGETTPAYFQSVQPHELLKPHNAESPVTPQ